MKERIQMYEPFFHHYYIDEVLNNYELETLIRVKKMIMNKVLLMLNLFRCILIMQTLKKYNNK